MNKEDMIEVVKKSKTSTEAIKKLGLSNGGYGYKKFKEFVIQNNVDITHFEISKFHKRYEREERICPVCEKSFETIKNHPRTKLTCSYSCSNKYFRSGKNNGNWKETVYRTTCFLYHEYKCVVCSEDKVVEVHHLDENKDNNSPYNLIPLCPTHHRYWHSPYKNLVYEIIMGYVEKFKESNKGL